MHAPVILLAAALAIAACNPAQPPATPTPSEPLPPSSGDGSVLQGADETSPLDPKSPEAASAVVTEYYTAIAAGEYDRAYALWGSDGAASGQTFEAFVAGFAETAAVSADVGEPFGGEGAVGSLYVSIPVTVQARTKAGLRQTFEGTYVLRRVNDVEGATAQQLRWHLASASLREVS